MKIPNVEGHRLHEWGVQTFKPCSLLLGPFPHFRGMTDGGYCRTPEIADIIASTAMPYSDRGRRPEGGLPGVFQRQSRFGRHDTRVKA